MNSRFRIALAIACASGCSRNEGRFAGKATETATATVNAAVVAPPLRTYESLAAEATGEELYRTEVLVEDSAIYRTPALSRDACVNVIGAVSSNSIRVTIDGPDLAAPAVEPGATLRVPGSTCARRGESIAIALRGRGIARLLITAVRSVPGQ